MKLDISHFKKVHEDHSSATLRHENGHEIKVSKAGLTAGMRAKLARLPTHMEDGGEVYGGDSDIMARMNQPATGRPTADWREYFTLMQQQQNAKDAERLALQHAQEQEAMANRMPAQEMEANRSPAGIGSYLGNTLRSSIGDAVDAMGNVIGGVARPVLNEGKDFIQGLAGEQPQPAGVSSAIAKQAPSSTQTPQFGNANLMSSAMRKPGGSMELQPPQKPASMPGSNIAADFAQVRHGIQNEAKAEGDLGRAQAQAADANNRSMQALMADHQQRLNSLNNEIKNTVKDINDGKINPEHYMESKSTGKKVATAIGLILGGIGGGLLHQENPALKFLNNNIDRDIEAQKTQLGQKNTVLSAYLHQTKDLTEATAMTKAFYMEKYANDIAKAAALSKDPMAKARADQTIGKLNFEKDQLLNSMAMNASINQALASGQNINPELLPPDKRERVVRLPGGRMGLAATKQDAEATRKALSHYDSLENQLSNLKSYAKQQYPVLNPYGEAASRMDTMQKNIEMELGGLHGLNRLSDVDLHQFQQSLGKASSWNDTATQARLEEMVKLVKRKREEELANNIQGYTPNPEATSHKMPQSYKLGKK